MWNAIYRKKEDIVSRRIAGETLLVPIRRRLADMGNLFALDTPTAEQAWDRMDGHRTLAEIRDSLVAAFEITAETAGADLQAFVNELLAEGLIEPVS